MGREDRDDDRHHKRRKHSHDDERRRDRDHDTSKTKGLPFSAHPITKNDMDTYREVFARYLKEKKDISIDEISSAEAYARFKSFVHKWYTDPFLGWLTLGTKATFPPNTTIPNFVGTSDVHHTLPMINTRLTPAPSSLGSIPSQAK